MSSAAPSDGAGHGAKLFLSCDINLPVSVQVQKLLGYSDKASIPNSSIGSKVASVASCRSPRELWAYIELFSDGCPGMLGTGTRTGLGEESTSGETTWNEWCTSCVKYRDLPESAQVAVTVYAAAESGKQEVVGGATLPLFDRQRRVRMGWQKVRLWRGLPADTSPQRRTPGLVAPPHGGQLPRLEGLLQLYHDGQLPQVEWLDRLALDRIREVKEAEEARHKAAGDLTLVLSLPRFDWPVAFHEPAAGAGAGGAPGAAAEGQALVWVADAEVALDNPAVLKQHKVARSMARGVVDRDLKPDSSEKRELLALLNLPPTRPMAPDGKHLLWKFRFSLKEVPSALTRVLKCVDWSDAHEAKQAVELMHSWAPIETIDALELLSPAYTNEEVRAFAVSVLGRAGDEEILSYLLQLVQALRHEQEDDSALIRFLVRRATANSTLANYLHWFLSVEFEDPTYAPRFLSCHQYFAEQQVQQEGGQAVWDSIMRQDEVVAQLCFMVTELANSRGHKAKVERFREMINEQGICSELTTSFQGMAHPLDPRVQLCGLVPEHCGVFKSAMAPLKLCFRTSARGGPGAETLVMFKKGDDLRQDQLCVQMISLMDMLLKRENLDLSLTPYKVLATGSDNGMVEIVPSFNLASVIADYRSVTRFLATHNPEPAAPYGIRPEALETYIKSCAGYCVITYIMGVGDRHLDNIMLTADGRLFHIDFGFIMGRDPKMLPPPMKLCKEMVEAMGGPDSDHYTRFKTYCCEAYNILRKSANLIINLFQLMAGANIPDISADSEKTMLKLEGKFVVDLDDEAAMQHFQALITESASALFPQMMETAHRWAQYWR